MAHAYSSKIFAVVPKSARSIVRDFESLAFLFPFVERSELGGGDPFEVGTIRPTTVADASNIGGRLRVPQ